MNSTYAGTPTQLFLALLCCLSWGLGVAQAPVQGTSDVLSFAGTPLQTDLFESDQELATGSVFLKPDGSVVALTNGATEARALASDVQTAIGSTANTALVAPTKLASVNDVMKRLLTLNGGPKLTADGTLFSLRLVWGLKIHGAVYQQIMSSGSCSDIPLYEDYSVTLRYVLSVSIDVKDAGSVTRSATPLQVDIIDPSPLYVHSRCWKRVGLRNNPVIQRQVRDGLSMEKRLMAAVQLFNDWSSQFSDDFEDDVLANLHSKEDASGNVIFDGAPLQVSASTQSHLKLRWTFTPDAITGAAFAALRE